MQLEALDYVGDPLRQRSVDLSKLTVLRTDAEQGFATVNHHERHVRSMVVLPAPLGRNDEQHWIHV